MSMLMPSWYLDKIIALYNDAMDDCYDNKMTFNLLCDYQAFKLDQLGSYPSAPRNYKTSNFLI